MPTAIANFSDVITSGIELIEQFGLTPFILAGAVVAGASMLWRKFKR